HPIKKAPMRSRTFAVKQPGFAKQQGPCTDGSHRVNLSRARANPVDQTLVVHFPYRAPTTWDDQDIQLRTRIEIVIGHNLHPTGSHNWRCGFSDQENIERRWFFAPLLLIETRQREHFKRSTEVDHFNSFIHDYANLFSIHS